MNIPLTSIDTDKVMAKKKKEEYVNLERADDPSYTLGEEWNACVAHNDTLTLDMDAEKAKEIALQAHNRWHDDFCSVPMQVTIGLPQFIAEQLLSNPAAWMKIGVRK